MVQSSLEFLIQHNVDIIQTLFGVLFLLLIFLILRSFKEDAPATVYVEKSESKISKSEVSQKSAEPKASPKSEMPVEVSLLDDLDNLEDLVGPEEKKNLTLDPSKPANAAAGIADTVAGTTGVSPEQKAELEKALADKEKVIADLKNEISNLQQKASTPNTPGADTTELEGKIKELSEKLAEYEIIEEDIANLSFYKNENVKLKNELEKLRAGGSVATAPATDTSIEQPAPAAATAEAPPVPDQAASSEPADLSSIEPGDVVGVQPEVVAETAPQPTPTAPDPAAIAEFEQAIQQKEALEQTMPPNPSTDNSGIDADILKEFEKVVQKEWGGESKQDVTEPAPVAETSPEPVSPVIDEIDTTKLLNEVEELAQTEVKEDTSAPENEEDSKQKLIAEFESFINKAQ
jgi:hypothetical protein